MPVDEKSPYLHMPLPHEANTLDQDLRRLRAAFENLDSHAHSSDAAQAALKSELEAREHALRASLESAGAELAAHLAAENPHNIPAASRAAPGLVQVGQGIELEQGVISVGPATDSAPGLMRPDNVTCMVDVGGVLRGHSMLCNTREVLTESGEYAVRVSGWYRVRNIGGGGAGGSGAKIFNYGSDLHYGPGGDAGGTTQFGDTPPARGGGGGAGGGMRGSGRCASSGGGGGAGEVVDSYAYLMADTVVAYIVGAGAPRNNGAFGSSAVMAGRGTGAGRYDGQGALGAGTATTSQWNAGQGGAYGSIGGSGGINGTGYGSGGGGGQNLGDAHWFPLGGIAAPDAENGWNGQGDSTTPKPAASYGGAGGNGAIILEYYDPNKLTA